MGLEIWINAYETGCPKLRYNTTHACWVALEEDPCLSGSCNNDPCHNYLDRFHKPDRLMIVSTKQSEEES